MQVLNVLFNWKGRFKEKILKIKLVKIVALKNLTNLQAH